MRVTYFAPGNTVALKIKSSWNCGSLKVMLRMKIFGKVTNNQQIVNHPLSKLPPKLADHCGMLAEMELSLIQQGPSYAQARLEHCVTGDEEGSYLHLHRWVSLWYPLIYSFMVDYGAQSLRTTALGSTTTKDKAAPSQTSTDILGIESHHCS